MVTTSVDTRNLDRSTFADGLGGHNQRTHSATLQLQATCQKFQIIHLSIHTYSIYDDIGATMGHFLEIVACIWVLFKINNFHMIGALRMLQAIIDIIHGDYTLCSF
ncbi:hypothetical protein D1872_300230 [compost metagenome]